MKHYYQISQSSDPKIIGVRNGVHQGEIIWKNFQSKTSEKDFLYDLFTLEKFKSNQLQELPEGIEIEYVKAYKMAKMTDIFGYFPRLFGINYFISSKFKEVLEQFTLPYVQFIPVNVYQEDKYFQYWAPYMPIHYREDSCDLEKSTFRRMWINRKKPKEYLEINNILDYKSASFFEPENLYFNDKFDTSIDLFDYIFSGGYIISEYLKDAIVGAKLTGVVVKEDFEPKIIVEDDV